MNEKKREEKIAGGEIRLGGAKVSGQEAEHGKIYRFFDNFWYHHKWKTVITLFFVIVITVCVVQMCGRESAGDVTVIMAGPYGFTDEASGYRELKACLSTYLPEDYDKNGEKSVDVVYYTIYSEEQIKASEEVSINTATNSSSYGSFYQNLTVGEAAVLFLDPWLFEELAAKNGFLVPLDETLGYLPAGGVEASDATGKTAIFGVKLGDTALYLENRAVRVLPEDTVVVLLAPLTVGKNSRPEEYAKSVAYLKAILK